MKNNSTIRLDKSRFPYELFVGLEKVAVIYNATLAETFLRSLDSVEEINRLKKRVNFLVDLSEDRLTGKSAEKEELLAESSAPVMSEKVVAKTYDVSMGDRFESVKGGYVYEVSSIHSTKRMVTLTFVDDPSYSRDVALEKVNKFYRKVVNES